MVPFNVSSQIKGVDFDHGNQLFVVSCNPKKVILEAMFTKHLDRNCKQTEKPSVRSITFFDSIRKEANPHKINFIRVVNGTKWNGTKVSNYCPDS